MTRRPHDNPPQEPPIGAEDPAVYSGRSGKGLSPFAIFVIATFWLVVIGVITMFASVLWGCVILSVAAVTLVAAVHTAG